MSRMPPTTPEIPAEVRPVRTAGLIVALLALVQAALGGTVLGGSGGIRDVHGYVGYATFVVSLVAAFLAWQLSRKTGSKGTFFHALSLPVLALLQIGLAEMDVKWVHVGVGVLFLLAAFGLYAMADRPVDNAVAPRDAA